MFFGRQLEVNLILFTNLPITKCKNEDFTVLRDITFDSDGRQAIIDKIRARVEILDLKVNVHAWNMTRVYSVLRADNQIRCLVHLHIVEYLIQVHLFRRYGPVADVHSRNFEGI
jgi:hypothetical protein